MIVSALLLQNPAAIEKFDHIYSAVLRIYDYLIKRGGVKMVMRQPPSKIFVLDCIKKLGFKIKSEKKTQG